MHPYELILTAMLRLQIENIELKRQLESIQSKNVTGSIADRIDDWLNRPYTGSSRKDIEEFSEELIEYMSSQLKA
ncbi:hypothetical protein NXZ77_15565 [Lysinibacillus boronitolerans]|uniref:hypothetical protein n=1 Tax=Lysinibacillus boronitolerans TaxID=309788 RepID=UPI0021631AD7|nr:hypothetical protein [Lysinibacillus boronitolerans]MCS1392995.1 hypothetical protein [Lysinibacillus boronitolerans]